jgi:transposase
MAHFKKNGHPPHTLVINADNGPENSGSRTQWLKRLVEFSATYGVKIQLAYFPPYHSKYNPVERVFGVLEKYWNGDPLRSVEQALGMASAMTYNGVHPTTKLIEKSYPKGVRLNKKEMKIYERCLNRLMGLRKWFMTILPDFAQRLVMADQGIS